MPPGEERNPHVDPPTIRPSDIPTHLLRAAYLIGKVPFRACRSDSRVSYSLYIPEQYCSIHSALYSQKSIEDLTDLPPRLPLCVNIHSTRRDAVTCRDSLIQLADSHGVAILVPFFPAGLDGILDLDSYKKLRTEKLQADLLLLDILNEITHMWPGINTDPIILMGFSGGAQFVHRFMYLYPERLAGVLIAAPGSTTKLGSQPWPQGTRDVGEVFGEVEVDVERIRGLGPEIGLFVGESEDEAAQEETLELQRWIAEREGGEVKRAKSRVTGLRELQANWRKYGIEVDLEIVPDVAHSYEGLLPAMLDWLKDCPAITDPNP